MSLLARGMIENSYSVVDGLSLQGFRFHFKDLESSLV